MTLEAALQLAEAGYYLLPGIPGEKRPYVKGGQGFTNATRSAEQIAEWWQKFPDAEILIATGPSGLVVFDIDGPAGEESFREFYGPDTPAPPTPIAATPRKEGGRQVLFRAPAGGAIKGTVAIRPGLDIRACGNVIVAPPAPGREWWHGCDPFTVQPAPLAERVLPMLSEKTPAAPIAKGGGKVPHGQRHDALKVLGARLRRAGLTPNGIFAALMADRLNICADDGDQSEKEIRDIANHFADKEADPLAPPSASLNPTSAREILKTHYPELRFLVLGLIVEGLTLLAGRPKIGKSWLALCLAVAVAFGGPFLGQNATTLAGVLYLALEDSPRRIKKRLRDLGLSDAPEHLYFLFELPRLDAGGAEALDAWLEEHPDVRLVIIDVFNRVRGARARNADPYAHDAAEMGKLQSVAIARSVSLVVITHDRKLAAEDWLEKVAGTLGVSGTADTVALLERDRNASNGRLRLVGRDLEEEQDLALEFKNGLWHVIGPGETLELTPERRAILEATPIEGAGFSPTQISLATGTTFGRRVSVNTVKHSLPALTKAGLVRKTGTGRYVHTPRTQHTEGTPQ